MIAAFRDEVGYFTLGDVGSIDFIDRDYYVNFNSGETEKYEGDKYKLVRIGE